MYRLFCLIIMVGGCAHTTWQVDRSPNFEKFGLSSAELQLMPRFLGTVEKEDGASGLANGLILHLDRWQELGLHEDGVHFRRLEVMVDRGYSEKDEREGRAVNCLHTKPSPPEGGISMVSGRVRMFTANILKTCTGDQTKDVCTDADIHPCKIVIDTMVIVSMK